MHPQGLQLIIRQKIADGRLPIHSILRVWGGPGHGETCDACDGVMAEDELVIEGMPPARRQPIRLHVECFYLCDEERRMGPWPMEP
jgi:hypothetical protein